MTCSTALIQNLMIHVGEYRTSARSADYNGWLLCDGRALRRTAFPDLFNVIGTAFGAVDGHTFNLPDFRGRVVGAVGKGVGLTNRVLGSACGEETHVLGIPELPGHVHDGETDRDGLHDHSGNTGLGGNHTHTTNATGGSVGPSPTAPTRS